ncbi:MAG TPA: hypothetical protein VFN09_11205, partial [Rhodanobacteraceae bacterium]|nr:hypothetical protein [Rhodanobacteraceae bacterium]
PQQRAVWIGRRTKALPVRAQFGHRQGTVACVAAHGCVLLGDPGYYGRFGFRATSDLVLPGVPPEYFQALHLSSTTPRGSITYHPAFEATS